MRVRTMFAASLACALPITGLTAAGGAAAAQSVNAQPVNAQPVRAAAAVPDDCPPPPDVTDSPMAGKYYCSQERFGSAAIPNDEQEWLDPDLAPAGLEGGYKVNNLIAKGYLSELPAERCNVTPTGS
ncbi:hypothetical protein ACIOGZ_26165 [Kitasatospora sp. NPDC088160]|uniref:hypothetical protein n=1 Tax=Kitasatospora sp. NPDC088160 TaxID=3364072 RepID=UPI0037FC18FF